MRTVITAAHLLTPEKIVDHPIVVVEDGLLVSIQSADAADVPAAAQHLDYADATLTPAFFDVHTHGGQGHDVMEASANAIDALGVFLTTHGVGSYFPTTVTAPEEHILRALDGLAQQIERTDHPGARPLGIHMEGPFLSCEKRGVHPPELLQPPSVPLFDRFYEAARGHIALMTMAPELPGAPELIEHATRKGVRISLGHSDAHTEAALTGIAAGARSATHTYNAMRALNHRDPGILGVVLDQHSLFAEIICDAIHVDPMLVRLYWKAKGPDRCILITDAISATGMPDGTYRLGNFDVTVANGTCLSEGRLAGSVLTLDRALQNFVGFTQCGLQAGLRCLTTNPAKMTGLEKQVGALEAGRAADITVLSPHGTVQAMLLRGQVVPATH
ncbi:MAG: N-acetylglucosamine-6-phosphate deacetylase [Acidobacteriaceae bacterium]